MPQVHPGVVKSNHLERTTFYGKEPLEERKSFRQTVRALPISQTPQEVRGTDSVGHLVRRSPLRVFAGLNSNLLTSRSERGLGAG